MRYRKLGKSELVISEIGFGAWGIGGATKGPTSYGETDDNTSRMALEEAYDHGITFFDTANIYGDGHSEELLGQTFSNKRNCIVIATKFGFSSHGHPIELSPLNIRGSLIGSLSRLKTNYVDLYQIHSPQINLIEENLEITEELEGLKREGLIRAYGISVKSPSDGMRVVRNFGFDSIQVNLSMIDQRAIEIGLLDAAAENGVGIIARTPLCFGFLSDKLTQINFEHKDHRSAWPKEQLKAWQHAAEKFRSLGLRRDANLSQLALKFCLYSPHVSSVIPGMMTREEVLDNIMSLRIKDLNDDEVGRIINIYRNNKFFIM